MIIGLTGTLAAGKGTIAKYLEEKGYIYHSCSDLLREELNRQGKEITIPNLAALGNRIREEYGSGELAKRLLKIIQDNNEEKVIVDSLRHPDEINELKKSDNFILIGIDAPIELRYKRLNKRGKIEDNLTFNKFKEEEQKQLDSKGPGQKLLKCLSMSDFKIINDGTIEELHYNIDKILSE